MRYDVSLFVDRNHRTPKRTRKLGSSRRRFDQEGYVLINRRYVASAPSLCEERTRVSPTDRQIAHLLLVPRKGLNELIYQLSLTRLIHVPLQNLLRSLNCEICDFRT